MFDLLILGGSAAGVTAAIYAARRKLNLQLITSDIGGEIATTGEIENYPGYTKISGFELTQKLKEQLAYHQVPIKEGVFAQKIEKKNGYFLVTAKNLKEEDLSYQAKAVIIATGVHPRPLNVPGEKEFFHRGVTYCAVCDAPLFKNKTVAVVGGGNSALESALMLGEIAAKVYLLNRHPEFRGETVLIEKAQNHPKIEIICQAETKKISGEKNVSGLEYENLKTKELKTISIQGIFVHVGWMPNSNFIDWVEKNKAGEIAVNQAGETNVPGIFAAGDVTDIPYKQIVVAAGMGALAALAAIDYLNKNLEL